MQMFRRLYLGLLSWRMIMFHTLVLLLCSFMIFTAQARIVIRFEPRSLFVYDINPGATTKYQVTLGYTTQTSVGSLDMQFCIDPIPYDPCVAPTGLDLTNATLSDQTGETGYSLQLLSSNHVLLTRTPAVAGNTLSTYTLDNVVNPTFESHSFAIRLSDYASTDGSGPIIDLGSVTTQITEPIIIETQVPPILVFCVAAQVSLNCGTTSGGNYADMGNLKPDETLRATSQMAAGTNASNGYTIGIYGTTMQAGSHVINALTTPTASAIGNSQFGINLVANTDPVLGQDPDGAFTNAVVDSGYSQANKFLFNDGDEVASAPAVSLVRRFTVSYIVNSPPDLRPGVYTTTLTYICAGRF
jgi:hypothetical protein